MKKGWRLSPAYDLTFSNTYYGEHTTMVDGNGKKSREKGTAGGGDAGRSGKKLVRGSNRKDKKYGGRTVGKIFIEVEV